MNHLLGKRDLFFLSNFQGGKIPHGQVESSRPRQIMGIKLSPYLSPCISFHVLIHTLIQARPKFHRTRSHPRLDGTAVLTPQSQTPHPALQQNTSIMCHSSHVMRHSGYRHLNPPKRAADGHDGTSGVGFYIHAFLLFCWFLASVHWAWVWYSNRRDARREEGQEQYSLPVYETQSREGHHQWEECGDQVALMLWTGDMSK